MTTGLFLSVLQLPGTVDRKTLVALIAEQSGIDAPTLRLRMGQRLPAIVGCVPPADAERAAAALAEVGGEMFLVSVDDLRRFGTAVEVRSLEIRDGRLSLDVGDGFRAEVDPADILTLVRAQTRRDTTKPPGRTARLNSLQAADPIARRSAAQADAAYGRTTSTREYLDLHTTSGAIFRVCGETFRFDVLGELRGHSAKANTDRLFELISHLAPDAIEDDFFKLWKPPPECAGLDLGGGAVRVDLAPRARRDRGRLLQAVEAAAGVCRPRPRRGGCSS